MKRLIIVLSVVLGLFAHGAIAQANFSGKWNFEPTQSKNIGMMAQGNIQTIIVQSQSKLEVDDTSEFNGHADTQRTIYDLTGKPVSNTSMMAGHATTRSHWEGARLITEWQSAGAIAGSIVKRIETRYPSPDGRTMYLESGRAGTDPMVIVFARNK
jgi:hypothetical protein